MLHMISPDAVFDALEAAGYREFSPMAPRGDVYKLDAVNPRGDLVALEISVFTGAIEQRARPGAAPAAAARALSRRRRVPRVRPRRRAALGPPADAARSARRLLTAATAAATRSVVY